MIERLNEGELQDPLRKLKPIGTGLIISYKNMSFLLTCKHVIQGKDIYITTNTKAGQPSNTISKSVAELLKIPGISMCPHPNPDVDLTILPLPMNFAIEDVLRMPTQLLEDIKNIAEGDDIFFLGFPLGITATHRITPLVRSGIVSLKKDDGSFLIDANVFPGNSGSPIFLKPSIYDWKTNKFGTINPSKLVGIIQSYISYKDVAVSQQTGIPRIVFEENSGLANALSTQHITEILESDQFKKCCEDIVEKEKTQNPS